MSDIRIPMAACVEVTSLYSGSHAKLEAIFEYAGVPGPPPNMPHDTKWKYWLRAAGDNPAVDSLAVLGRLLEEFMDVEPFDDPREYDNWTTRRAHVVQVLEENGFRYFRGGRVLPSNEVPLPTRLENPMQPPVPADPGKPKSFYDVIETVIKGLPRAMHPLVQRRKGVQTLKFEQEVDLQDLLHALLRPWIKDIRPEDYIPSYAGKSTRIDFILPAYKLGLELKVVRDVTHAQKVGDELLIDIDHYREHPRCDTLWCVVYDPQHHIKNPAGLSDLNGKRTSPQGAIEVRVFVLNG